MKLINSLINKDTSCLPIWFMRQAGRYLPEFQKIRSLNQDFIKLCLNSNLSSEISLQPLLRYNLDAAIIFSDILMVPYGLGQRVKFQKNFGPILSNFNLDIFLKNDEKKFSKKLKPVYDAIKKTRLKLEKNKSLISFVGAPWTLIIYMLGLKKEKNILDKEFLKIKKNEINLILNKLNKFLCLHIKNQVEAGADVVQIFDSWAGLIDENDLDDYCYGPNLSIVNFCKNNNIPVICFPKGLNKNYFNFNKHVKPDGINIDYDLDPEWARENLDGACIQGGMDPKVLLLDDKKIFDEAEKYLKIFKDYPYIFNLGHGLLPQTNPEKVKKLIKFIREYK
jgi:uroporphyrinogen decarboxylase